MAAELQPRSLKVEGYMRNRSYPAYDPMLNVLLFSTVSKRPISDLERNSLKIQALIVKITLFLH